MNFQRFEITFLSILYEKYVKMINSRGSFWLHAHQTVAL